MGLPGVEKLNGPCGILLHLSRGSQLPYSEKSEKKSDDLLFKYIPYIPINPFKELPMHGPWRMKFGRRCSGLKLRLWASDH